MVPTREKKMLRGFSLLFSSSWSYLMKYDKQTSELVSKTTVPIDFSPVSVSLIGKCILRNVTKVTSEFPTGFVWV